MKKTVDTVFLNTPESRKMSQAKNLKEMFGL